MTALRIPAEVAEPAPYLLCDDQDERDDPFPGALADAPGGRVRNLE